MVIGDEPTNAPAKDQFITLMNKYSVSINLYIAKKEKITRLKSFFFKKSSACSIKKLKVCILVEFRNDFSSIFEKKYCFWV